MPTSQIAWSATFHHLFNMISRIWTVTRTVISLSPAPAQASAESSAATSDRPDHEIARAYEIITGMDGDGEGEDDEDGMDHTGLLSGCWRATKEAGWVLRGSLQLHTCVKAHTRLNIVASIGRVFSPATSRPELR
jgi:hypothetical protein